MHKSSKELKVMHFNTQSLKPKVELLSHFLAEHEIDICTLNETWLTAKVNLNIKNFKIFRKDRDSRGGGVCILVRNHIDSQEINLASKEEAIAIRIKNGTKSKKDIIIATYYNKPSKTIDLETIEEIFDQEENVLLLGDLNGHSPLWNSSTKDPTGTIIENTLEKRKLLLLNNDQPTYAPLHKPDHRAILDLAICTDNLVSEIRDFSVTDEIFTDHLPIIIRLASNYTKEKVIKPVKIKTINWETFTREATERAPPEIDQLFNPAHIELQVSAVTNAIFSAIEASITHKEILLNTDKPLLLPQHIVILIKEKRAARRKYQRTKDPNDKSE